MFADLEADMKKLVDKVRGMRSVVRSQEAGKNSWCSR